MHAFQLTGLSAEQFEPLFALSDEVLSARGIRRVIAGHRPGYPCRVSLEDAEIGEELLLLPYQHHAEVTPYAASGPIYVRRGAAQRNAKVGEVPEYVSARQISVRSYNREHMMIRAEVCSGADVTAEIVHQFSDDAVRYIHLHNAKRGCFSCLVRRV